MMYSILYFLYFSMFSDEMGDGNVGNKNNIGDPTSNNIPTADIQPLKTINR